MKNKRRKPILTAATNKIIKIACGLAVAYVAVAFAIFLAESQYDDALIKSYPQALWYTLVTVSTVGYGDLYPMSGVGRILASVLILVSVGSIGFVLGKFGELAIERNRRRFLGMDGTDFKGHYIVIGWGDLSRIVIKELIAAGLHVAAVTHEEKDITDMRSFFTDPKTFFVTFGQLDEHTTYERTNVHDAAGVILLTGDDTLTLITVLQLKQLNPALKITAHIKNSQLKRTIENAGVSYVIAPDEVVGRMIASATFEPDVSSFLEDILSTTTGDDDLDVQEYQLPNGHELVGKTLKQVGLELEERTGAKLLSYSRRSGDTWTIKHGTPDTVLEANDYLIVLADHFAATKTSAYLGVKQGRRL